MSTYVPVIDISALVARSPGRQTAAAQIGAACRESGFFYITGHGIEIGLQEQLELLSREFFALPMGTKMQIAMDKGGRAWRGYFPVGGELTSGKPDIKEGVYFGEELPPQHPLVKAGVPLHGANLFPAAPAALRPVVFAYLAAMTKLAHTLMEGISLSLGLPEGYFHDHYTANPLYLFRIFNYPPPPASAAAAWGVGEHTDYGVLTILKQDHSGGLEVKNKSGWVAAPPVENSFVCNIGDMLDRMTGGLYKSTPHRVKNTSGKQRLSFPYFFDPNFSAEVKPLPIVDPRRVADDAPQRWDGASVHAFQGTYGEYLLGKVGKVFPQLKAAVLKK